MDERDVATEIGESMGPRVAEVILGLGSNRGDRVRNLERALGALILRINLQRTSSIYETEPVGVRDQEWFLNLVCIGVTQLQPRALLEFASEVEIDLGREPGERHGPRVIDVDILAYEDEIISEPDLEIPHPRLSERRFVLEPLAEIAPEWRHPESGRTPGELLETADPALVRPYSMPPPPAGAPPIT